MTGSRISLTFLVLLFTMVSTENMVQSLRPQVTLSLVPFLPVTVLLPDKRPRSSNLAFWLVCPSRGPRLSVQHLCRPSTLPSQQTKSYSSKNLRKSSSRTRMKTSPKEWPLVPPLQTKGGNEALAKAKVPLSLPQHPRMRPSTPLHTPLRPLLERSVVLPRLPPSTQTA